MEKRALFDKTVLNVLSFLESCAECHSLDFRPGDEVQAHEVAIWEKRNAPYKLPTDLKNFHSIFNGIQLNWNAEIGDRSINIGEIKVNKLEDIERFIVNGFFQNKWKDVSINCPDFAKAVAYTIDTCDVGTVHLLYQNNDERNEEGSNYPNPLENPEVWLVDRCGRYHYICPSFKQYLRLMVTHLGIRGWQLAFTPEGLSPETQQWMNIFCKERLITDLDSHLVQLNL